MKSILSMLICIGLYSGSAMAEMSVQKRSIEQMSQNLDEILANRKATVSAEQRAQLMDQFDTLSQMNWKQLVSLHRKTQVQQFASCRLSDAFIISNAVAEAVPLGTTGIREINARYLGLPEYLGGNKGASERAKIIYSDRVSWASLFGGGLGSIPGVLLETLASYDKDKVEAEIQKAFPGTQMVAYKLKGDASFCGQATLKMDILKAILKNSKFIGATDEQQ